MLRQIWLISVLLFHTIRCQSVNIKIGVVAEEVSTGDVLQLALKDILANNHILPYLSFSFEITFGCSDAGGITHAAELYYLHQVQTIIGPHCAADVLCVAKVATRWSLPVVTYAQYTRGSNIAFFDTMAKLAPTTVASVNDAIMAVVTDLSWKIVTLIYNSASDSAITRAADLGRLLTANNVAVKNHVLPSANMTWKQFEDNIEVDEIKAQSRVIALIMGDELIDTALILQQLAQVGITASTFAIFIPWASDLSDRNYPWIDDTNGYTVNDTLLKTFAGTFVVDDDRRQTDTKTRFFGQLANAIPSFAYYAQAYHEFILYDTLKLLLLAINSSFTQFPPPNPFNGSLVAHNFANAKFEGASGIVQLDANRERVPYCGVFTLDPSVSADLVQVASLVPKMLMCNDTSGSVDDCLNLVIEKWDPTTKDNLLKRTEEPACGFDGSRCDYSKWYFLSGGITIIILGSVIGIVLRKKLGLQCLTTNGAAAQLSWHIPIEKVEVLKPDKVPHHRSESELSTASALFCADGETAIVFNNVVKLRRFRQLRNLSFEQSESQLLLSLKQLVHDNINPLLGLCYNNPTNELWLLSKYCTRGTLSDYLHNSEMRMDSKFKTAFLRDIINGLDYLHAAPLGYHGNLTTSNCAIDANFIVKLVAVGVEDLIEDWKRNGQIAGANDEETNEERPKFVNDVHEDLVYRAPELLRQPAPSRTKVIRMSKMDQLKIKMACRAGDIYSFGIISFEILFRQKPFSDKDVNLEVLLNALRHPVRNVVRPSIPKGQLKEHHHPAMLQLMQTCWNEDPTVRPPIKRVRKLFSSVYKVRGGLVDSIIQMMDQHANSLEKQVRERTRLLEEAHLRADRLLAQMIPKDVARDLKLGRPIIPRSFPVSSILFTDIVSFTTICGQSTPIEIVSFLNDLFTGYDAIISQTDAYKVETIGDAYLVVSGVPNENGTENVRVIAAIALQMRQYLANYKLPHLPEWHMRARWGLHTGPVAAGVVGLIAPRYCLFGDTVNVASRMESTGEPGRIQVSLEFHAALTARKDPFVTEKRGTVVIKGKGDCLTYWLVDTAPQP